MHITPGTGRGIARITTHYKLPYTRGFLSSSLEESRISLEESSTGQRSRSIAAFTGADFWFCQCVLLSAPSHPRASSARDLRGRGRAGAGPRGGAEAGSQGEEANRGRGLGLRVERKWRGHGQGAGAHKRWIRPCGCWLPPLPPTCAWRLWLLCTDRLLQSSYSVAKNLDQSWLYFCEAQWAFIVL